MRSSPRVALTAIAGVMLAAVICRTAAGDPSPSGFLEGNLKITSMKEVELAGAGPSKAELSHNYDAYTLVVLSRAGNKLVASVTPDRDGNYRVALPPGDYILDVEGRKRAKPQSFTVSPNQTVRVDMTVDAGVR
jgi:hypothetical protein